MSGAGRPARLIVVRTDQRLGNLLLLTPFLQRLRESFPAAHLGFVGAGRYEPLLRGGPWIDEWLSPPSWRHAADGAGTLAWTAGLWRHRWDLAFEASNPDTHSFTNCLWTLVAGAAERIGFDHSRSRRSLTTCVPPPEPELHFSLAPLRLLRALGQAAPAAPISCPATDPPTPSFAAWGRSEGLGPGSVVVHLGGRDTKAWPEAGWSRLLPGLAEVVRGPIVLLAGPSEQNRLASLQAIRRGRFLIAPPLTLPDLVFALRTAAGFVGCDSGAMHLAVAVGTPTTALFFRSNPWRYAPLGTEHRTVLLADPFRVEDRAWAAPVEGMRRAPIHRPLLDGTQSRSGIPQTGPAAVVVILSAIEESLRSGAGSRPETATRGASA